MNINVLTGLTMKAVTVDRTGNEIFFEEVGGRIFRMFHSQGCCEDVEIDEVDGEIDWLVGSPFTQAEEATSNDNPKDGNAESFTWTFYRFATEKGHVSIKWYGSSNGFYSESVDFEEV